MAKTDLKLYSKAQGSEKKITTSLPYINPATDSTTLKQFAVKLNNFTTNTYSETDRVQTINVDTEQVPVDENAKLEPVVTRTTESGTRWNPETNSFILEYDIESDGQISVAYTINDEKPEYVRNNFYVQYTKTTIDTTHKHLTIGLYTKEAITSYNGDMGTLEIWTQSTVTYKAKRTHAFVKAPA